MGRGGQTRKDVLSSGIALEYLRAPESEGAQEAKCLPKSQAENFEDGFVSPFHPVIEELETSTWQVMALSLEVSPHFLLVCWILSPFPVRLWAKQR